MLSIAENLHTLQTRIAQAKIQHGRVLEDIALIAVSKQQSPTAIDTAYTAGQYDFGENYVQEALPKMLACTSSNIRWHFLGAVQSNKIPAIAKNFDWVHSVSSLKIAQKLSAQRNKMPPLQICLQVQRDTQSIGAPLADIPKLAAAIAQLPHLQIRGLMVLGIDNPDFEAQCTSFAPVRKLFCDLKDVYPDWDTLSMGMSQDLEAAICMGSTCLRIGSAIFGNRPIRRKA